jgi:MFS family permease
VLWTKIDTTLEPKLREDFGYSPSIVSLFYTIQFVGYLIVSPFCHKILQRYNGTLLTVLSFYIIGIASFMIGPSYLLEEYLPNDIFIMISGLFLTGLATSFTTIGTYQEMYQPFIERHSGKDNSE